MVSWRSAANWLSVSFAVSLPATFTVPLVGRSRPPMMFSSVDFPLPLGPIRQTNSPGITLQFGGNQRLDDLVAELVQLPHVGDFDHRRRPHPARRCGGDCRLRRCVLYGRHGLTSTRERTDGWPRRCVPRGHDAGGQRRDDADPDGDCRAEHRPARDTPVGAKPAASKDDPGHPRRARHPRRRPSTAAITGSTSRAAITGRAGCRWRRAPPSSRVGAPPCGWSPPPPRRRRPAAPSRR